MYQVAICHVDDSGYFSSPYLPDQKLYLSPKKRQCSWNKAAEFDCREDAVNFFDKWAERQKNKAWKLDVVELIRQESVELELFDQKHPLSELGDKIPPAAIKYAEAYFYDYLHKMSYSKSTLRKYRNIFLPFGFDINQRVKDKWNLSILRQKRIEEFKKTPEYKPYVRQDDRPKISVI